MKRGLVHRIIFQIHLWTGLSLGIYAFLIGVTGSVLVFREEIVAQIAPLPRVANETTQVSVQEIHDRLQAQYPDWHVWSLEAPRRPDAPWSSFLLQRGKGRMVFVDRAGNVAGERHLEGTWLGWFERFHSNLLIRNGGRWYNGVAGLALACFSLTGLYLWWPARGQWSAAFRIVRTSNWKGWVYDLHRVGGAVTLAFTLLFCITGAYFTWPAVYRNLVASVLPMKAKETIPPGPSEGRRLPLDALLAAARRAAPEGEFLRMLVPANQQQPVRVMFRHGSVEQNHKTSQVTVHAGSAAVLSVDAYGERRVGDHVVSLFGPLHTGHFGGLAVRIIWAAAGMALPLLFVTGVLMWCNRVVTPRLRRRADSVGVELAVRESR